MITQTLDKIIRDFLIYYKVEVKDLNFLYNNTIPVAVLSNSNSVVQGLRNLVLEVSSPKNNELDTVQDEWVEYIGAHGVKSDLLQVLKEVNNYLMDKTYFVGNQIGAIDILMYYLLYNTVLSLSFQEKEKYIHLSRWFDVIQHYKNARLWRSIVPFSRCCLYI